MKKSKFNKRALLKNLVGKMCNLEDQIEEILDEGLSISRDELKDLHDLYLADERTFFNAHEIRRKQKLVKTCKQTIYWLLSGARERHCKNCVKRIHSKRLKAVPTAQRCIDCQIDFEDEIKISAA